MIPADVIFVTKADARAWLARMETDVLDSHHVDPTSGRERFGDFSQRWLQQRELRRITPATVRAWHGRLAQSSLHPNTVAKLYQLFRTMMDTAVDDALIRANPVHIKGAAAERTVERPILEWDEVQRIADTIHPRFSALVWVAATSGLRFGELGGLTRSHVDLEARTLRVEGALAPVRGTGPTLEPPKSVAAHRTVTIPSTTVELLSAHLDSYANENPDAFVFTSVKGSPLLNGYFAHHWKRALKAAGIDHGVRFHDLRHLAGTSAATAGASLREIMARMGHASPDASLRYLSASERRDGEIAEAIEKRMTGDLGRSPD